MKPILIAPFVCLLMASIPTFAQEAGQESKPSVVGFWNAELESPGGSLRFGIDVLSKNGKLHAFLVNGPERIEVPNASADADGKVAFSMDHFDSSINAVMSGTDKMAGIWKKRRGPERWSEMKFSASRAPKTTPKNLESEHGLGAFLGRWEVDFAKSEDPAIAVFKQSASMDKIVGTFLTTTGDYRYLDGVVREGQLELSCFDGGHAFLFRTKLDEDGKLSGDFWSSDSWHETWTATLNHSAKLPDAFKQTKFDDTADLNGYQFPDLAGKQRGLNDPAFAGKARIIYVFGSWCPNCHDAASYFKQLEKKYGQRGLSILGLAFELTGDFDRDVVQVRTYLKRHGVDYPVLIAGVSDKAKATEAIPFLDKVRSYPTTIFLDAKGNVKGVHTGFTGPATGVAYKKLKTKFEDLIEEILVSAEGKSNKTNEPSEEDGGR